MRATTISKTIGAAAIAGLLLSGCSKKDETASDTTAAMTNTMAPTDTMGASSNSSTTSAAPSGLSDANIVAILDAANMGDSTLGAVAATKGTASDVRNFAKTMMRDHHALRKQGQDLAKKLAITPQPPPNDSSQQQLQQGLDLLNKTAKGKDFDKAYIDHEVDVHKAVLETATKAMAAAQNTELKNLIQKAAPTIQAHLDAAEKIQSKMK